MQHCIFPLLSCCFRLSAITSIKKKQPDDTKTHLHFYFMCRCSSRKRILNLPLVLLSRTPPHLRDNSQLQKSRCKTVQLERNEKRKKKNLSQEQKRSKQLFRHNFSPKSRFSSNKHEGHTTHKNCLPSLNFSQVKVDHPDSTHTTW